MSIGSSVPPFTAYGGAVQRRIAELSREQARRGHDVTVLAPGSANQVEEIDGVRLQRVRCRTRAPWRHAEFQAKCAALFSRSRRIAPDVVHVHNEPEFGLAAYALHVPAVLSYDNFHFRRDRMRPATRRSLRGYRFLLPVSRYCQDASAEHWDLPLDRMRILPNGVNTSQFAPDPEAAAREREPYSAPVVLYLGRICQQKGVHVLLDAINHLRGYDVALHVLLAGPIGEFDSSRGGSDQIDWQQLITRAGAEYVGRLPDARLPGLLTMADIFVMPTIALEMQGMAALEAQACGTPVVATDHGGLPETVPPTCGALVAPGDAQALGREIARLIRDEPLRRTLSEAALDHARSLSWVNIVDRLELIYDEATSDSQG